MIYGFRKEAPIIPDQFWLTDEQFSKIAPHLPTDTRGKARVDDRRVISGIVHVLKSGGRWIDAPADYGPKKTLYNRYVRWAAKGVWVDLFHALAQAGGSPEIAAELRNRADVGSLRRRVRLRTVMSSIMRRRRGLIWVIWKPPVWGWAAIPNPLRQEANHATSPLAPR